LVLKYGRNGRQLNRVHIRRFNCRQLIPGRLSQPNFATTTKTPLYFQKVKILTGIGCNYGFFPVNISSPQLVFIPIREIGAQAIQAALLTFLATVGCILPVDANSVLFRSSRNHLDTIVLRDPVVFFV
jgi:hypothetical protein